MGSSQTRDRTRVPCIGRQILKHCATREALKPYSLRNTFFFKEIYLFIYFWLRWAFVAARRLCLLVASRGYSLLRCTGASLWWLLLLWGTGSRCAAFSSCGTWAQQLWFAGSSAQAQHLWHTGLVAPWHVGSSWTGARTHVPCIGRRILNHCATRKVPRILFLFFKKYFSLP